MFGFEWVEILHIKKVMEKQTDNKVEMRIQGRNNFKNYTDDYKKLYRYLFFFLEEQ